MPSIRNLALFGTLAFSASADRGGGNKHNIPILCNNAPDESPELERRFARGQGGFKSRSAESADIPIPSVSVNFNKLVERSLLKRGGTVSYAANCDDPPPNNSKWPSLEFPTKKSVLEAAYADAVKLADSAKTIDANSKAFTHYFGGEKADVQLKHFQDMMTSIASAENLYSIHFDCSGTGGACNEVDSALNTDATLGGAVDPKTVWVCERFWIAPSTRFLITPKEDSSPPYRPATPSGWCAKDKDGNSRKPAQFFATAGHSILHELTHLDALSAHVGLEAPLEGDDVGRHGTDDAQDGCELDGARKHLIQYEGDASSSPDYNAESYAAAATEKYFMDLCQFREIKPLVKDTSDLPTATSIPGPSQIVAPAPAPTLPAPTCAGEPNDDRLAFDQPNAVASILQFCVQRSFWGTVIVPAVALGTGKTSDGRVKALDVSSNYPLDNGDKLYISLAFSEDSCIGMFQFDIGQTDQEKIDHCFSRFLAILNGCNTAGLFPKYGGTLNDVCAVYTLTARKGDAPDPTVLKSKGDLGAFLCEKTDTSALGPGSALENTCTCHYENVPGPFETFKMPQSGDCKDTNKADLLIN